MEKERLDIILSSIIGVMGILVGIAFGTFFLSQNKYTLAIIYFGLLLIGIGYLSALFIENEPNRD